MSDVDYDTEQNLIKAYNFPLILKRAIQEMQGIAAAIIYDGRIDEAELTLLKDWVNSHVVEAGEWPLTDLVAILKRIFADGAVTDDERNELFKFMAQFAAGPKQPAVIQGVFETNPNIIFRGHSFMFTGRLIFGARKKAEHAVMDRGGKIAESDTVSSRLNFLVVGELGNEAWKYSRFGSKIEAALRMRKGGSSFPAIIHEKDFVAAVVACPMAG